MYLPETNAQMFDILTELRIYAAMNGLPHLAEKLDDALILLTSETRRRPASRRPPSRRTPSEPAPGLLPMRGATSSGPSPVLRFAQPGGQGRCGRRLDLRLLRLLDFLVASFLALGHRLRLLLPSHAGPGVTARSHRRCLRPLRSTSIEGRRDSSRRATQAANSPRRLSRADPRGAPPGRSRTATPPGPSGRRGSGDHSIASARSVGVGDRDAEGVAVAADHARGSRPGCRRGSRATGRSGRDSDTFSSIASVGFTPVWRSFSIISRGIRWRRFEVA